MEYFVDRGSIVRQIWGKGDTILFIFAGASAEFALNKAVDWLYFTGRLPADPLGRLFSTVSYARKIVFAPLPQALKAIDTMRDIHSAVEQKRGDRIPDWAYRDVLFMLIHYSIAAFELLERKMTDTEKQDLFQVFNRIGERMGIAGLPSTYTEWLNVRKDHLYSDLERSHYTDDLFRQYKKHLGSFRYFLLIEGQAMVVPERVKEMLNFRNFSLISPLLFMYKLSRKVKADLLVKSLILPVDYRDQIKDLDVLPR